MLLWLKWSSQAGWHTLKVDLDVQGVYGWRVHPTVRSYPSYKRGYPPPEPEPYQAEPLDAARAKTELAQLGVRLL